MKTTLRAAIAAIGLITAVAAHAESEGNGDPFAFRSSGLTTTFVPSASVPSMAALPQAATPQPVRQEHETAEAPPARVSQRQR